MRETPNPRSALQSVKPLSCALHVLLTCVGFMVAGCGFGLPPFQPGPEGCSPHDLTQTHLILTFDDGPFPADRRFTSQDTDDDILASLNTILATLERRNARAVFYIAVHVAEPPEDDIVIKRADVFARGISSIHDAGHVLGYHAFDHAGQIWANPLQFAPFSIARMITDLAKLESYIDFAMAPTGLSRDQLFSPVFRQPFGGDGICANAGHAAARRMGWVFHGCHIDSGDWTKNLSADPAIVRRLHVATPDDEIEFVRARLRDGLAASDPHSGVDIQFHVNAFTAAHLDEWITILQQETQARTGVAPALDVPDCYLADSDPYLDPAIFRFFLNPPPQ